jgi:hypothetical protein
MAFDFRLRLSFIFVIFVILVVCLSSLSFLSSFMILKHRVSQQLGGAWMGLWLARGLLDQGEGE